MGVLPSGIVIGALHALKEVLKGDRSGDPVLDVLLTSSVSSIDDALWTRVRMGIQKVQILEN